MPRVTLEARVKLQPAGWGTRARRRVTRMPKRSKSQRAIKRHDRLRRNWCRRCPFCAPAGRCLDRTIRTGRCGDWVYYLLPGNKQCRRRWVRPKDPRTSLQLQNRNRFATASHRYSAALTEAERVACIARGAKLRSRRRLGQSGPLTGQQYSVHHQLAANAGPKVPNARNRAEVLQPQRLSRPTSGPHRGVSMVPPGQHRSNTGLTGKRQGRMQTAEARTKQGRGALAVRQPRNLMRRRPGLGRLPGRRILGGGGGGRRGNGGGRRSQPSSRQRSPANNRIYTNAARASRPRRIARA